MQWAAEKDRQIDKQTAHHLSKEMIDRWHTQAETTVKKSTNAVHWQFANLLCARVNLASYLSGTRNQ